MKYRHLGKSGLEVSELSFGSWVTFGTQLDVDGSKRLIRQAIEAGVNFLDNAEGYANGMAESLMGQAIKAYRREDLVISTKIFWGGNGPNQTGLSRKHLLEGTRASLKRLELDYVDLLFCHRPDPNTPIEETVLAMDYLVRSGQTMYWGTSEWSASQITAAIEFAKSYHAVPPVMEQPQYNLLVRDRFEQEYAPIFEKYGYGTTIWSPLASGVLSGKYNKGIPTDSRLARVEWLQKALRESKMLDETTFSKVEKLAGLAKEIGMSISQLSIAWTLKNPHVSSTILGASTVSQLTENLQASDLAAKLDAEIMGKIESIMGNKPR
jgi:voltage-dependent potassium channel beta subunit